MNRLILGTLLIAFSLFPSGVSAKNLRVSPDGNGANGFFWHTAFPTIREALVAAASGDDLWIREGVYNEAIDLVPGVSLFGGFAGDEAPDGFDNRRPDVRKTVIDASGLDSTVVVAADQTLLDGLTITGGDAELGGGIRCETAGLTIIGCTITNNRAVSRGAGVYCENSVLGITACNIIHNSVGYNVAPLGSALYLDIGSSSHLDTCLISHNRSFTLWEPFKDPGPVGSPIEFVRSPSLTITRCVITQNEGGTGGAIIAAKSNSPHFPVLVVVNSLIIDNSALGNFSSVGAIWSHDVEVFLDHCTVANNSGAANRNAIRATSISTRNCIILNDQRLGEPMDTDPLFVDPQNGNYRLQSGSPFIDAGTAVPIFTDLDGNPRPIDIPGVGRDGEGAYDMGAYEFPGVFRNSFSDINRDGRVDALDLMILMGEMEGE